MRRMTFDKLMMVVVMVVVVVVMMMVMMMVMVMMVMSQGCKVQRSNEEFSKRSNEEFYKRTRRNVLGEELYKCVRTITNRIIIMILIMLLTLETVDHCGVCVGLLDTGLVI